MAEGDDVLLQLALGVQVMSKPKCGAFSLQVNWSNSPAESSATRRRSTFSACGRPKSAPEARDSPPRGEQALTRMAPARRRRCFEMDDIGKGERVGFPIRR